MKTSLDGFWFHTLFYLFLVWQVQPVLHPDKTGNGKWPPPPEPTATPLHQVCSAQWEGQVGGGFLWTKSFTHRKIERKLKIKLFDRYFSSFSQWLLTWCFFGFVSLIVVVHMEQQHSSSPLKNKLMCPRQLWTVIMYCLCQMHPHPLQ